MFSNIKAAYQQNKVVTGVTGLAATTGLVYSMFKKKSFWGTLGYTAAFALAGYFATSSVIKITSKN